MNLEDELVVFPNKDNSKTSSKSEKGVDLLHEKQNPSALMV